jgi:orotate phosphoribosyltransferase
MNKKETMELLVEDGVIIANTHVVLKSKDHSNFYFDKDMASSRSFHLFQLAEILAQQIVQKVNNGVDVVASPAYGAISLGALVAYWLERFLDKPILFVAAEKAESSAFRIRPRLAVKLSGKRVVVVEDVTTTGGSTKRAMDEVVNHGGIVVCLAVLCNRGNVDAEFFGVPWLFSVFSKEDLEIFSPQRWAASECPLCRGGTAINTEVGHGKEFLASENNLTNNKNQG